MADARIYGFVDTVLILCSQFGFLSRLYACVRAVVAFDGVAEKLKESGKLTGPRIWNRVQKTRLHLKRIITRYLCLTLNHSS